MLVHVFQVGVHNEVLSHEVAMERGELRGIEGHEEIRHNTTSAIDRAMQTERLVAQRVGKVDAVGRVKLAVLEATLYILSIFLVLALLVRLLYATARRGIVVCHGETDHRPVAELDRSLHKALSE